MNKESFYRYLIQTFILFLIFISPLFSENQKTEEAEAINKKWLEEEVVFIITPKEKEVFLKLKTVREKIFIDAFWKQRDPELRTPQNEFREEHYRRIAYADRWLGRESPGPGWRSARGRIYIILGAPKSIEKFENRPGINPIIIWFYSGMEKHGLPNTFNIVFFKKGSFGEYKIYSPATDGPQYLLVGFNGAMTDYAAAYAKLYEIEPNIAKVALSLIPGENTSDFYPSMASEILISAKIEQSPYRIVEDAYAEKLLQYKDIIEVEYSANYIDSDFVVKIIQDKYEVFFIHYSIEPKKLSLDQIGDRYRTAFEVDGIITDQNDKTVYQFSRNVPVEIGQDQFSDIKNKLFSFQDMFPLIEGKYKMNLLLKNTFSKEFTSFEANLTIPSHSSLYLSPLILANKAEKNSKHRGKNKPFLIDHIQLVPSPRNDFTQDDTLFLYFQIGGNSKNQDAVSTMKISFIKNNKVVHSIVNRRNESLNPTDILQEVPLTNFSPDYYEVQVVLLDSNQHEILQRHENFYITPIQYLIRPWVLSYSLPSSENPIYSNIIGVQYLNRKEMERAASFLKYAYRKNPNSLEYARDYCKYLIYEKKYHEVNNILLPFLSIKPNNEILNMLGQCSLALGKYDKAVSYFQKYLDNFGVNIDVLNSLGECYSQLGNTEQALKNMLKSLEIDPNQKEIERLVLFLRNKK